MKLKVSYSYHCEVSGEIEIPDTTKIINGKLPSSLYKRIDDYINHSLMPKFLEKSKKIQPQIKVRQK